MTIASVEGDGGQQGYWEDHGGAQSSLPPTQLLQLTTAKFYIYIFLFMCWVCKGVVSEVALFCGEVRDGPFAISRKLLGY
jgi:hypothetical protein